jgi:hypothetical protein
MTMTLRLGTFSNPVLLEAARQIGALDDAGLDVEARPVPSSPAQFRDLRNGELDAVLTNPDNLIAYRYIPQNPLGELLDVVAVAAIDRGLGLTLCAAPGIAAPSAGMRLGVDAASSGFALLAYGLLAERSLAVDSLAIETLGSTPRRARALVEGECDVTMLNAGHELIAIDRGCTALGTADDLGPYLGTVLARLAGAPSEPVLRLAAVLLATAAGIVAGELDGEVRSASERILGLSAPLADGHLAVLRDPRRGLVPEGIVDDESMETVLDLRERYLPDPAVSTARAHWREMLAGA